MPPRLKVCSHPGCSVLSPTPRCPTHTKEHGQQQWQARPSYHALYNTRRWKRASRAFLATHPYCGDRPLGLMSVMSECRDQGLKRLAEQTDHVVPHHGDLLLFWDLQTNGQSLCAECHSRKTKHGL